MWTEGVQSAVTSWALELTDSVEMVHPKAGHAMPAVLVV
jgi:hypothetical protein